MAPHDGKDTYGTIDPHDHIEAMAPLGNWIEARPQGIYVPQGDFWIDPSIPCDRALITHGHSDHARGGHNAVLATRETLAIMECRYGPQRGGQEAPLGERIEIGGIGVTFHPAGHVLGSAQIMLEHRGERIIVSGDYKRRPDPTCRPFEPIACDIFITEATFGLPVFRHPDTGVEIDRLIHAIEAEPERSVLVGAYALGKAQRVIAELRARGWNAPLYIHGALQKLCALYAELGIDLGELRLVADVARADLKGQIVLAPPSALNDRWSRRLPDPISAMASGWMRVRQRARQRNVELPLVISDHADWDELTRTITEIAPAELWVTHGREEALVHWCAMHQIRARALALIGRDDEDD